jgi:hypothetical protein
MNLYPSFGKADSAAFMIFIKAKTNSYLYIVRWKVSKNINLWAVFSQKEAEMYKIPLKSAQCVGNLESTIAAKADYLKLRDNPIVQKHDTLVKYLRSSRRTSELERECENY